LPTKKFSFGLNRLCVIAILNRGDSYGYLISRELPAVLGLSESSLYPVLKKFERQGAIESYSFNESGRLRRYYRMTDEGKKAYEDAKDQWQTLRRWMEPKLNRQDG
jgi:PadR family transcriptional regulator PadR